ncbi:hypothetical protein M5D96_003189, partial [Drosophila gunungcola]
MYSIKSQSQLQSLSGINTDINNTLDKSIMPTPNN